MKNRGLVLNILDAMVICIFLIFLFLSVNKIFGAEPLAPIKRKAPEVAFQVPGHGHLLLSMFHGKVVCLEFIETWCPHCQAASHVMSDLQNRYGKYGFQAIDIAFNDDAGKYVLEFSQEQHTTFPVGWTYRNQVLAFTGFSVIQRFVVPQLILIDRRGYIHWETPALGDEYSYEESTIAHRIELLLKMR